MPPDNSNDNRDDRPFQGVDAHGQAAMLLVESLLHELIARDAITVAAAIDVIDIAVAVAAESDSVSTNRRKPETILTAVSESLRRDLPRST